MDQAERETRYAEWADIADAPFRLTEDETRALIAHHLEIAAEMIAVADDCLFDDLDNTDACLDEAFGCIVRAVDLVGDLVNRREARFDPDANPRSDAELARDNDLPGHRDPTPLSV